MNLVKRGGGQTPAKIALLGAIYCKYAWTLCKKYDYMYLPVKFHPLMQCLF